MSEEGKEGRARDGEEGMLGRVREERWVQSKGGKEERSEG